MRTAVFSALLLAVSAHAQVVTITTVPANPVAGVPFVIRAFVQPCFGTGNTIVSGGNIDIHLTAIPIQVGECGVQLDLPIAPLPAGTYTIRLFAPDSGSPFKTQAVTIGADVPALDPKVMGMLALALIVLAMVRLKN